MQASFGRNQRWIVGPEHAAPLRRMFLEVFGARVTHESPSLTIYTLSDDANVGVFVEPDHLSEEAARLGAWLEFAVPDPDETGAALEALGVRRVDFRDQEHRYHQAPGGPIFRLARR